MRNWYATSITSSYSSMGDNSLFDMPAPGHICINTHTTFVMHWKSWQNVYVCTLNRKNKYPNCMTNVWYCQTILRMAIWFMRKKLSAELPFFSRLDIHREHAFARDIKFREMDLWHEFRIHFRPHQRMRGCRHKREKWLSATAAIEMPMACVLKEWLVGVQRCSTCAHLQRSECNIMHMNTFSEEHFSNFVAYNLLPIYTCRLQCRL